MSDGVNVEHELKCLPGFFLDLESGDKTFEIRKDDRGYRAGDTLCLREWSPSGGCTGRAMRRQVTYMTDYEQQPGYVVLALSALQPQGEPVAWVYEKDGEKHVIWHDPTQTEEFHGFQKSRALIYADTAPPADGVVVPKVKTQ
jgi:hypothetical protein